MNKPQVPATAVYKMSLPEAIEYLGSNPRALAATQAEAFRLHGAAVSRCPGIANTLNSVWDEARTRSAANAIVVLGGPVRPPLTFNETQANQLVVAAETLAICNDVLSLTPDDLAALTSAKGAEIGDTAPALAVIASRPALAWWNGRRAARRAAERASQEEARVRAAADMPRALLHNLRGRGIHIKVGKAGALVVAAGTDLSKLLPTELSFLAEVKTAAVAVLRAEEAADRLALEPKVLVA